MKEATGELNMTVITIVAIGALVAFFYLIIWPNIQVGMTLSSACNSAGTATYHQEFDDGSFVDCVGGEPNNCTYTPAGGGAATNKACS